MPQNDPNNRSFGCKFSGCGGTMKPQSYGWRCDECSHRELDYSRQSVMEADRPAEYPWTSCDCVHCKAEKV